MDGKNCKRCNTWKPLSEYYRDRKMCDGLYSYCKHCAKNPLVIKQCMKTGEPVAQCRCYIHDRRPRGGITLTP